jgi:hypothetical protein
MFGRGGKLSLMSKSVMEIRINIHLARENLTTRRTHDLYDLTYGNSSQQQSRSWSGSHLSLVHVFHVIPLRTIHGWPVYYHIIHHYKNGEVLSNSATVSATKFEEPHKFHMC